jgi:hypothetical protein
MIFITTYQRVAHHAPSFAARREDKRGGILEELELPGLTAGWRQMAGLHDPRGAELHHGPALPAIRPITAAATIKELQPQPFRMQQISG